MYGVGPLPAGLPADKFDAATRAIKDSFSNFFHFLKVLLNLESSSPSVGRSIARTFVRLAVG